MKPNQGNVYKVDRTLALNEMVFYVRKDAQLRRRWQEDFDRLAQEFGLTSQEVDAVKQVDVKRMNEMGVHQYLIAQILRLTYGAKAAFGVHPAMEAYKRAYPENFPNQ